MIKARRSGALESGVLRPATGYALGRLDVQMPLHLRLYDMQRSETTSQLIDLVLMLTLRTY